MKKPIREQAPGESSVEKAGEKMIIEAVDRFFSQVPGEIIEYMESVLFEWYQHHAREHYSIDHVNEVVNNAFRVNELLLKLNEAMIILKKEQGLDTGYLILGDSDIRTAC
jgi:hypothetical protein